LKTPPLEPVNGKNISNKQTLFSRMKNSLTRKRIGYAFGLGSLAGIAGTVYLRNYEMKQKSKSALEALERHITDPNNFSTSHHNYDQLYGKMNDYWKLLRKFYSPKDAEEKVIGYIIKVAGRENEISQILDYYKNYKIIEEKKDQCKPHQYYIKDIHLLIGNQCIAYRNMDNILFYNQPTLSTFIDTLKKLNLKHQSE